MKYILYKDGSGLCKTREGERVFDIVTLRFAGNCGEVRVGIRNEENGERFYKITDGSVAVPKGVFSSGENKITVYGKDRLWVCESLILDSDLLYPAGCDSTEEILAFKSEYEKLQKRLSICEIKIRELENAVNGVKLFE